jgi:hypothetical protein
VSRTSLLLLLVLAIGLMGGSTCHFSSGGGKKKHIDGRRDGEDVQVVVDTRTSNATQTPEPHTAEYAAAVVQVALAASVMPLSLLEASDDNEPLKPRLDLEEPVLAYAATNRVRAASIAGAPEPAAATVFVTGTLLLVWHLRRRRGAASQVDALERIAMLQRQ